MSQVDSLKLLGTVILGAKTRSQILADEARYFEALLRYRAPEITDTSYQLLFESQIGPLSHLQSSASQVANEIFEAQQAIAVLDEIRQQMAVQLPTVHKPITVLNLLWLVSGMHQTLEVLLARLGELHSRFEQVVKYSIPDHPAPSARGLRDSTLVDRFIAELARQVYRDIAYFVTARRHLGSTYPHESVPRVYVTRAYEPNVHVTAFRSAKAHREWLRWHASQLRGQPAPHATARSDGTQATLGAEQSFVAVKMPYWLPDCLELLPVLGHELAHAVLRDALGSPEGSSWELEGPGPLQKLLGGIRGALLLALPDDLDDLHARYFATEFVADALGYARFRDSFLFALVTEIVGSDLILGSATDAEGQTFVTGLLLEMKLRQTGQDQPLIQQLQYIIRPQAEPEPAQRLDRLFAICRLKVLLAQATWHRSILSSVAERSGSGIDFAPESEELLQATESVLHLLIEDARTSGDTAQWAVAVDRVSDGVLSWLKSSLRDPHEIDATLIGETLSGATALYWEASTKPSVESPFAPRRPKDANYFLWRQRISTAMISPLSEHFSEKGGSGQSVSLGDHVHDMVWRSRWRAANPESSDCPTDSASSVAQQSTRIVIDDYLFRNSNPRPLFDLLGKRAAREGVDKRALEFDKYFAKFAGVSTNTLDPYAHVRRVFWPGMIIAKYLREGTTTPALKEYTELPFDAWDRNKLLGISAATTPVALAAATPPYGMQAEAELASERLGRTQYALSFWLARTGNVASGLRNGAEVSWSSALLMGRYDGALLAPVGESVGELRLCTDTLVLVQRRLLSPIFPSETGYTFSLNGAVAMTMLALSSPLAWRVVLHWLRHSPIATDFRSRGVVHDFYLSDGWEQAILVFRKAPSAATAGIDDVLGMMEEISRHPLVGRTETLFTEGVFDLDPGEKYDVSYRFRCRAHPGTGLCAPRLQERLREDWLPELPLPLVRVVSGLTDYEVRIEKEIDEVIKPEDKVNSTTGSNDAAVEKRRRLATGEERRNAGRAVHERLNFKCAQLVDRLITQIAFAPK